MEIPEDGRLTGLKRTDKVEVTFGEVTALAYQRFTDVAAGTWYENVIQFAVDNGLFYGTSDTTFNPNSDMTRRYPALGSRKQNSQRQGQWNP